MKLSIHILSTFFKLIWNIVSIIFLIILKVVFKILQIVCFLLACVSFLLGFRPFMFILIANIVAISFPFLLISALSLLANKPIDPTFKFAALFLIAVSSILYLMGKFGNPVFLFISQKCGVALLDIPIICLWIPLAKDNNRTHTEESQNNNSYNEYSDFNESQSSNNYDEYSYTHDFQDDDAYEEASSNLFVGINDKESLKKRYRDLLKIYHPDNNNGNTHMAQVIQSEYEDLLADFSNS